MIIILIPSLPFTENDFWNSRIKLLWNILSLIIKGFQVSKLHININNVHLHLAFKSDEILHYINFFSIFVNHFLISVLFLFLMISLKLNFCVLSLLLQVVYKLKQQFFNLLKLQVTLCQLFDGVLLNYFFLELVNEGFRLLNIFLG